MLRLIPRTAAAKARCLLRRTARQVVLFPKAHPEHGLPPRRGHLGLRGFCRARITLAQDRLVPATRLRLRQARSVLEMVLQDFRRQRGTDLSGLGIDRAHDLAPANYLGRGQARDFCRQHEIDL